MFSFEQSIKFFKTLIPDQNLHPTFLFFFIDVFKSSGDFHILCMNNGHNFSLPVALQVNETVTWSFDCLFKNLTVKNRTTRSHFQKDLFITSQLKMSYSSSDYEDRDQGNLWYFLIHPIFNNILP